MPLNIIVNWRIDNRWWGSKIMIYEEGLGYGDLFINGSDADKIGESIKKLVEQHNRNLGRYILCVKDDGEISGYTKSVGCGWVQYSRVEERV